MKTSVYILLFLALAQLAVGQGKHYSTENAHSHNDYEQNLPFYDAYARHFGSIEADLWAVDGTLYVAHDSSDIASDRTFEKLYLKPLLHRISVNGGQPYKNGQSLQLLIDLKSPYDKVLPLLEKELKPYEKYFDIAENPHAVRLVLSGNMPPADSLHVYDEIFTFDGRLGKDYPTEDLQRITLVSANVQQLVSWKEGTRLTLEKQQILQKVVDSIHHRGKLIRFWATPNTKSAYKQLMELGVDYIGSDKLTLLECLFIEPISATYQNNDPLQKGLRL